MLYVELVSAKCLCIDFVILSYLLKNLRDGIKTKKFQVEKRGSSSLFEIIKGCKFAQTENNTYL